jgi:rubrerythrin
MGVAEETRQQLLVYQRNEITEYHIYTMLAKAVRAPENKRVLETIAADELRHYHDWRLMRTLFGIDV